MASKYFKAGQKVFEFLKPKPKVNKTKLDKVKSDLAIAIAKTKGSKAKLKQTLFEIENKQPLTFKSERGIKTKSNTEKAKIRNEESKKMFKKTMEDNKKVIKNIMRGGKESKKDGGRMGLKKGGGSDLGMQSVKHGIDKNPNITAADPKAKFIAKAKNKKSKKKFI
jgi:hypothetical protein